MGMLALVALYSWDPLLAGTGMATLWHVCCVMAVVCIAAGYCMGSYCLHIKSSIGSYMLQRMHMRSTRSC